MYDIVDDMYNQKANLCNNYRHCQTNQFSNQKRPADKQIAYDGVVDHKTGHFRRPFWMTDRLPEREAISYM